MAVNWRQGTFEINTIDGVETVRGWIGGELFGVRGVRRHEGPVSKIFNITHLPSGYLLDRGTGVYLSADAAKRAVEIVLPLANNWVFTTARASEELKPLGERIRAAIKAEFGDEPFELLVVPRRRELIVRDQYLNNFSEAM